MERVLGIGREDEVVELACRLRQLASDVWRGLRDENGEVTEAHWISLMDELEVLASRLEADAVCFWVKNLRRELETPGSIALEPKLARRSSRRVVLPMIR